MFFFRIPCKNVGRELFLFDTGQWPIPLTSYFSIWFFHFIDQILSLSGQIPISHVKNGRERLNFSILEIYRCHTLKDVLNSFFFSSFNHLIFKYRNENKNKKKTRMILKTCLFYLSFFFISMSIHLEIL